MQLESQTPRVSVDVGSDEIGQHDNHDWRDCNGGHRRIRGSRLFQRMGLMPWWAWLLVALFVSGALFLGYAISWAAGRSERLSDYDDEA